MKASGDLSVLDFFTPMDMSALELADNDFGSGGVLLIPDRDGSKPHLAVAAGKIGLMFLLDRENLGKFDPTANHVLAAESIGHCWCGPSYFVAADGVGRILSSGGDTLTSWRVQTSPVPSLVKEWDAANTLGSHVFQKGFFTSVSSDGAKKDSAIVWAVQRPVSLPATLTLWAFDAKSGAEITALSAGNWPNTGGAANVVPVVANWRVFVASNRELRIFGLGAQAAQAVALVAPMPKAPAGSTALLYGTVAEIDGSTLWLRTRARMERVDISDAERASKTVTMVPGRAVAVNGRVQPDGSVRADSIDYAPDSPALWKADE